MTDLLEFSWQRGGYRVDVDGIYTPRTTIATEHVDLVDLRRPLLPGGLVAAGTTCALAWRFTDVLTTMEICILATTAVAAVTAGVSVGRLRLQSFSIRDVSILLPIWVARPMRAAIEEVLKSRGRKAAAKPWRMSE